MNPNEQASDSRSQGNLFTNLVNNHDAEVLKEEIESLEQQISRLQVSHTIDELQVQNLTVTTDKLAKRIIELQKCPPILKRVREERNRALAEAERLNNELEVNAEALESMRGERNGAFSNVRRLKQEVDQLNQDINRLNRDILRLKQQLVTCAPGQNEGLENNAMEEPDEQGYIKQLGEQRDKLLKELDITNDSPEEFHKIYLELDKVLKELERLRQSSERAGNDQAEESEREGETQEQPKQESNPVSIIFDSSEKRNVALEYLKTRMISWARWRSTSNADESSDSDDANLTLAFASADQREAAIAHMESKSLTEDLQQQYHALHDHLLTTKQVLARVRDERDISSCDAKDFADLLKERMVEDTTFRNEFDLEKQRRMAQNKDVGVLLRDLKATEEELKKRYKEAFRAGREREALRGRFRREVLRLGGRVVGDNGEVEGEEYDEERWDRAGELEQVEDGERLHFDRYVADSPDHPAREDWPAQYKPPPAVGDVQEDTIKRKKKGTYGYSVSPSKRRKTRSA